MGPLEDYRNPARQHLAFFHASTCQEARWRIAGHTLAITMMLFIALGAYDQAYTLWPSFTIAEVVGDGSWQVVGT